MIISANRDDQDRFSFYIDGEHNLILPNKSGTLATEEWVAAQIGTRYAHHITSNSTATDGKAYAFAKYTIVTDSPDEMDNDAVKAWLFEHGFNSSYNGLQATGYRINSSKAYPMFSVYSTDGSTFRTAGSKETNESFWIDTTNVISDIVVKQ